MAYNRSLRFYGVGFGSTPAEIVAQVNGVQVYSGPVPTLNEPRPANFNPFLQEQIMFTIENSSEFNTEFQGVVPVSITVTSGDLVIFTSVTANHWGTLPNPAFTAEQYAVLDNPDATVEQVSDVLITAANPAFSPEEEVLLATLLEAYPDRANELNNLREQHNVAYSIHLADSWEDCADPVPNPNPDYPWYVYNNQTVNCEIEIIRFL